MTLHHFSKSKPSIQTTMKRLQAKKECPEIIQKVGFDFDWDSEKVWSLKYPIQEMNITELLWHFDIPFWDKQHTNKYNLTPWQVIKHPTKHLLHNNKIKRASLKYPIDIMKNKGRWLILDGLHRLVKAYQQGHTTIQVRKIPRSEIKNIKS